MLIKEYIDLFASATWTNGVVLYQLAQLKYNLLHFKKGEILQEFLIDYPRGEVILTNGQLKQFRFTFDHSTLIRKD